MIVFISDPIPQVAANKLRASGLELREHEGDAPITKTELLKVVGDIDYLVTSLSTTVDAEIIEAAPNLKLIANYGAGFNNIDIAAAKKRGIPVTNTPAVSTEAVSELTIGLIIAISRRVVEGDQLMRTKGFAGWQPLFFLGHEIAGKQLGIIGAGNIGRQVARQAGALGMKVTYWQPHRLSEEIETELNLTYQQFNDLLAHSDYVSLHAPLTPDNKHLIDAEALKKMKKTAMLVNAARGPIVDEKALVEALQNGEIAGAALDVYEAEPVPEPALKSMKNVILTPHIGNATVEARDAMAEIVANNIIKHTKGEEVTAVNA